MTNKGNVTLTNVMVADTVGGVTVSGGPDHVSDVGETDTTTFTGVYYITQADIDAGHFYNTATADSEESGPDSDDEDVPLPQNARSSISRRAVPGLTTNADGFADVGELINYTFTVTTPAT